MIHSLKIGWKTSIQQRSFYEQNMPSYTSLCRTDFRLAKALFKSASAGFPSPVLKEEILCLPDCKLSKNFSLPTLKSLDLNAGLRGEVLPKALLPKACSFLGVESHLKL
jgi:hypothetical protein